MLLKLLDVIIAARLQLEGRREVVSLDGGALTIKAAF